MLFTHMYIVTLTLGLEIFTDLITDQRTREENLITVESRLNKSSDYAAHLPSERTENINGALFDEAHQHTRGLQQVWLSVYLLCCLQT